MGNRTPGWSPWLGTLGGLAALQHAAHTHTPALSAPLRSSHPCTQITIWSFPSTPHHLKLPEHWAQRHSGEINEVFSSKMAWGRRQLQQSVTQMTVGALFSPIFPGEGVGRDTPRARRVPPRGHPTPWPGQKAGKGVKYLRGWGAETPRQPRPLPRHRETQPGAPEPAPAPAAPAAPRYVSAGPGGGRRGLSASLLRSVGKAAQGCAGRDAARSRLCPAHTMPRPPKPHPCPRPHAGAGEEVWRFTGAEPLPVSRPPPLSSHPRGVAGLFPLPHCCAHSSFQDETLWNRRQQVAFVVESIF